MARTYSTLPEAIQAEIIEPIEAGDASASDYNIIAIAEHVLGDYTEGYACVVTAEEFWTIVEQNAVTQ